MNENYPHIKFEIDRTDPRPTSFLEINGERIRFMRLEVKTIPTQMPLVTISVYARLLEGEIKGAKGEIQIIHVDESTKGLIGQDTAPLKCACHCVKWNPGNKVIQCHKCGRIVKREDGERLVDADDVEWKGPGGKPDGCPGL